MRKVITDLQPSVFEDIIALVALYRPGPMEQIPNFIAGKHGHKVSYPHPKLEELLRETYGVMIYQERIMLAAAELAGFSLGQADLLRRAMGEKQMDIMREQRKAFVQGCVDNGWSANRLKKSTTSSSSLLSTTASTNPTRHPTACWPTTPPISRPTTPLEFMAAMLPGGAMTNSEKVAQNIEHCRRLGIEVLPPDINESGVSFTVVGDKIRFGLGAVKNVGAVAVEEVLEERRRGGAIYQPGRFLHPHERPLQQAHAGV